MNSDRDVKLSERKNELREAIEIRKSALLF